jgi:hypothetical protein
VTPPAIVIRLELEAAPHVYVHDLDEAEEARLGDWIREARPQYGDLISRALALAEKAKAA